ncbi:hypothetical protein ACOMHN_009862 [Nucella lapillus]
MMKGFVWVVLLALLSADQLLLSNSENVVLQVHRSVLREGFHREIQTTVTMGKDVFRGPRGGECGLLLIEHLPSSLYVDPFQLLMLAQSGGPQVLAGSAVDIEAPEYLSAPLDVFVYSPVVSDTSLSSSHLPTLTVTLPVHVRYHRPSPDPQVTDVLVTLYHPRVLLNCTSQDSRVTEAPCDASNTSQCAWSELSYRSDASSLEIHVPVGREEDVRVVVFGTIVVTVMGASCLLYVMAFWDFYRVKIK